MRNVCARCMYWEPPKDKPILCDVEGVCRYRPYSEGDGESCGLYVCLTEACGCCEFFVLNPEAGKDGQDF